MHSKISPMDRKAVEETSDKSKSSPYRLGEALNLTSEETVAGEIIRRNWKHVLEIRRADKWLTAIEKGRVHLNKRFSFLNWMLMIFIAGFEKVSKYYSNQKYSFMYCTGPITLWITFLVSFRGLVLDEKYAKKIITMSVMLLYVINMGDYGVIHVMAGSWFWVFVYYVVDPLLFYGFSTIVVKMIRILKHNHRNNVFVVASDISKSLFSTLPIICIMAFQAGSLQLAYPKIMEEMCQYMPGSIEPLKGEWMWGKCTDIHLINKYYPKNISNGKQLKLQIAIEEYVPLPNQMLFISLNAIEPIFLLLTSQILLRICRLRIQDILALRASGLEIATTIVSLIVVVLQLALQNLSMSPFEEPITYSYWEMYLLFFFGIPYILRCVLLYILLNQGETVMNIEEKHGNTRRASTSVQIILKRKQSNGHVDNII